MSDLERTSVKTKLAASLFPSEAALPEDDNQRQQGSHHFDDDSSSASSVSSTGTVRPSSSQKPAPASQWSDFFEQELYLEDQSESRRAKFHVFVTPPAPSGGPLIVVHHGAGSSALSFALFAQEIRRVMPEAGVLAVDAREHGSVVWNPSGDVDSSLSITNLSQDFSEMVRLTGAKLHWAELPPLMLVGHSLGGAVVTDAAAKGFFGDKLLGYAVLDVVEGSALEALKTMQTYLSTRPSSFPSPDAAIEWHIRSRTLRNPQSARASVPSLLYKTSPSSWTWRTQLEKTEPYWEDWFVGMSSKFLKARGAKLLLLAGTDRLDKELMIGQMQGKFQLQVFPTAGHFIQEDLPDRTAELVAEFVKRNDRRTLVLPPKVSDLLKQGKKV